MLSENTANREKGTWTKIYHNGESEFPTMLKVKHVLCAGVWLPDWEMDGQQICYNKQWSDVSTSPSVSAITKWQTGIIRLSEKIVISDKEKGERRRIKDGLHHAQFQLIMNVQCCICTTRTSFQGSIRISWLLPIQTFNTTTFLN